MGTTRAEAIEASLRSDTDVDVYAVGLFCASVCSKLDAEATVERVNSMMHGVTSWQLSSDATFANGDPMPRQCENDQSRQHFLLE